MQNQENGKHSSSSGLGRSQNDSGIIQRKLQRAYQEKELLLGEVQSLRQQLRSMKEQQKSKVTEVGVPTENIDGWNHLLEANMKSGTLACVWCIKTHYVKMIASAFGKWKCFTAYECALAGAPSYAEGSGIKSGTINNRFDTSRMRKLLTSAQKVMTSKGDDAPNFMKHRTRSANSSPVATYPYQGNSAFVHSLRRRSLSPGRNSNAKESKVSKTSSPPKKMPSYSTPTYSSLKMFNQGSPTNSFRHPNRSAAYMAYLNSKGESGHVASMANTSPPSLRPTANHAGAQMASARVDVPLTRNDISHDVRDTTATGHTDFADDVSEISSDNDEVPVTSEGPTAAAAVTATGSRSSPTGKSAESGLLAKTFSQPRNNAPPQSTPSYAMSTRPGPSGGGTGPRGPTISSTKMIGPNGSRRPTSAGVTSSRKPKMDKAQMRLLYGSVDDAPVARGWSSNLRIEGATTRKTQGFGNRSTSRRSSFRFKL